MLPIVSLAVLDQKTGIWFVHACVRACVNGLGKEQLAL